MVNSPGWLHRELGWAGAGPLPAHSCAASWGPSPLQIAAAGEDGGLDEEIGVAVEFEDEDEEEGEEELREIIVSG